MTRDVWGQLLADLKQVHDCHSALSDFCPYPTDITPKDVAPYHIAPRDLFEADTNISGATLGGLHRSLIAASPLATWRETYKDTDIGQDFLDQFGCYCVIGPRGAFSSDAMLAFVVYMPPHLHYPWHEHPAEELYFVLSGQAEFHRDGELSEVLGAGDASFHGSNQPHAMTTHDTSVTALVLWRNGFDTGPKLSS